MIFYVTIDPVTLKRTILNDGVKPDPGRPFIELVEMAHVVQVQEFNQLERRLEIERTFNRKIIEALDQEMYWTVNAAVPKRVRSMIAAYETERDRALKDK